MTLRELANSGIKFTRCSILAIVEDGRVDFPVSYIEELNKVADEWMDRQVLSIYPENGMLFIKIATQDKSELMNLFDFDEGWRQAILHN
jgi:hypothetical protein